MKTQLHAVMGFSERLLCASLTGEIASVMAIKISFCYGHKDKHNLLKGSVMFTQCFSSLAGL